jgi:hypothetical protein
MAAMSNQRLAAGLPFFFKQRGGLNENKTGHLLDGRMWHDCFWLHGQRALGMHHVLERVHAPALPTDYFSLHKEHFWTINYQECAVLNWDEIGMIKHSNLTFFDD